MAGNKRTRGGQVKQSGASQQPLADAPVTESTPQCAQSQLPSNKSTEIPSLVQAKQALEPPNAVKFAQQAPSKPRTHARKHAQRQKLPKLPSNVSVSKRPLIHPQIPTPFASSLSPKTLYITATTPFVPALKRIRKLLSEISRREKQSLAATSKRQKPIATNGRLDNGHVERDIADEVARGEKEGEKVYLKATGRAIPRALELGVQFQAEGEGYLVRVEMGSVKAVDDIEVKDTGEANAVDEQAEIPETRMRTVSSVTVSIGLK